MPRHSVDPSVSMRGLQAFGIGIFVVMLFSDGWPFWLALLWLVAAAGMRFHAAIRGLRRGPDSRRTRPRSL